MPENFSNVVIAYGLGTTPATTHRATGTLYLNADFLGRLNNKQWEFIKAHELYHTRFNSTSEEAADEYASQVYLNQKAGSPLQSLKALTDVLNESNPEHRRRVMLQLRRAAVYDCEVNKHAPACAMLKTLGMISTTQNKANTGNHSAFTGGCGCGCGGNCAGKKSACKCGGKCNCSKAGNNYNRSETSNFTGTIDNGVRGLFTSFGAKAAASMFKDGSVRVVASVSAMPAQVFDEVKQRLNNGYSSADGSDAKPTFGFQAKPKFSFVDDTALTTEQRVAKLQVQYQYDLSELNRQYNECQQSCKANHPYGPVIQNNCVKGCTSNYAAQAELLKQQYAQAQALITNQQLSDLTKYQTDALVQPDLQQQQLQAQIESQRIAAEAANPNSGIDKIIIGVVIAAAALLVFIVISND